MDISDIKAGFDLLSRQPIKTPECYLIFSRGTWESEMFKKSGYDFTKEELDAAEKLDIKLIGVRHGVKCYLTPHN